MRSIFCVLTAAALVVCSDAAVKILNSGTIHLGAAGKPEWARFADQTPRSEGLSIKFDAQPNAAEATLLIRQEDVKQDWIVELNGSKIGNLFLMEADLMHCIPVPAGALKAGENDLSFKPKKPEDILLHEIVLVNEPQSKLFSTTQVRVTVTDALGRALPARVTIVNEKSTLMPLTIPPDPKLAARPGVVYTGTGSATIGLLDGSYTIFATRGSEFGMEEASVHLQGPARTNILLRLRREVDTRGWVACDTHIHTLTRSKHGDATLFERVVTLAGEGVELPVSTEHNLHSDFAEAARTLGLERFLTSVAGNELTTKKGHFNVFPVDLNAAPPDAAIEDWPKLMKAVRSTPGVQAIVLNHPHDIHSGFTPFAGTNFNAATGRNLRGVDFTFDAVELINSGAMRSDWMEPVRSWFGLLNRGYRITGVGGSDSHDTSRFIVGQGRTYVRADDSDPGNINITNACANLKAGRAVVSLGIFPEITINNQFGPGDLVTATNHLTVRARAASPSWVMVTNIQLYANGTRIMEEPYADLSGNGAATPEIFAALPRRTQDYGLVMIATGPGVTEPYWAVARPYQPSSLDFNPVVLGITNPVWIDADGDGKFSSPRDYAEKVLQANATPGAVISALAGYDTATAVQAAELLEERGADLRSSDMEALIGGAAETVRAGFELYLASRSR